MHAAQITLFQDAWIQKGSGLMALHFTLITQEPVIPQ